MRKTRGIFGILCVVFCMAVLLMPAKAEAASAKTKAIKAYKTFLENEQETEGDYASSKEFLLAYVDNNSVPELYYDGTLYTFKSGKVISLVAPVGDTILSGYYKKKGIVTVGYAHTQHAYTAYYRINGRKATEVLRSGWDISAESNWTAEYTYLYKSKNVTKKTFNKKLKGYVGSRKLVLFEDSAHANTAANRKKYLK